MDKKYAWVNERIIDGKLTKFFRGIDDPKDEIQLEDKKTKKIKIKNYK